MCFVPLPPTANSIVRWPSAAASVRTEVVPSRLGSWPPTPARTVHWPLPGPPSADGAQSTSTTHRFRVRDSTSLRTVPPSLRDSGLVYNTRLPNVRNSVEPGGLTPAVRMTCALP